MAATHAPPDCAQPSPSCWPRGRMLFRMKVEPTRPPSTLSPNAGVAPRSNLASVMPLSATGNFRPATYILFKAMRRPPEKALGGAPAPANGCGFPLAACQPPRASSPAHDPDEPATPCLESAFCAQCADCGPMAPKSDPFRAIHAGASDPLQSNSRLPAPDPGHSLIRLIVVAFQSEQQRRSVTRRNV